LDICMCKEQSIDGERRVRKIWSTAGGKSTRKTTRNRGRIQDRRNRRRRLASSQFGIVLRIALRHDRSRILVFRSAKVRRSHH